MTGFDKWCTILVGPPGSGKTTACKEYLFAARVSQDEQGKVEHYKEFQAAVLAGINVVVDRMNFSVEQRARYIHTARMSGYGIRIVVLQVPYSICLGRMQERGEHPTISTEEQMKSALHTFYTKYERPTKEECDILEFRGHDNPGRGECIIVDLDGTLCDTSHRQHFMNVEGKKDWKGFFAGINEDGLNKAVYAVLDRMYDNTSIVLASGRPDDYMTETKAWLMKHDVPYGSLFMRRRHDFRRDDIVKEVILDFEILPRYKPLFVLDDRKQVVDMWRRRGIACFQVAEGDF